MSSNPQITELENKLIEMGDKVGRLRGEYELLSSQQNTCEKVIIQYESDKEVYGKAVELLSLVQAVTRDKIKAQFESLVTFILKYVTEKEYKFILEFDRRGNLQELNFKIIPPGESEPMNPLDQSGGGILDLVSLGLRIVLMEISQPKSKAPIIFDEACKHLSVQYMIKIPHLLEELSKKLGKQIIFITHSDVLINSSFYKVEVK